MKLPVPKRDIPKRALAVVVILAAVAGVVTGRERPALDIIQEKSPARNEARIDIDLSKLERAEQALPQSDPFAPRGFGPAAPARAAAAAAQPQVPPLPFQYVGKVIEAGKQEVYVMRGEELLTIARGQKIGNEYRVERITPTAITFTYLPLKTRQTLELPAVN